MRHQSSSVEPGQSEMLRPFWIYQLEQPEPQTVRRRRSWISSS